MEGARLGVTSAGNRKEEEELGEDVTLTETSTFSEITLTDESDTELSPRKVDNKNQTLTIEYYLLVPNISDTHLPYCKYSKIQTKRFFPAEE